MREQIKLLCNEHPSQDSVGIKRRDNFWTIGSASYKDKGKYTEQEYLKYVAKKNLQLLDIFPEFYRFQLEYFSDLLKATVQYMPDVSIPGFHVFKYCKEFEKPLARPHVDVPFNQFDWGKRVGYNTIFTHVVPVEVPDKAGMWVWDITADDIDEYGFDKCKEYIETHEPFDTVYHYTDNMIFHSGRFAHQIKPFERGQENKWRITLQSHAVKMDGVWYLYW